jgi:hypothetical protein
VGVLLFLSILVIALLYYRHRKRQQRKRPFEERMMGRLDSNQLPVSSTTITPTPILLRNPSFDRERMVPEEVGPDQPPTQLVRCQPLYRQTSYASESQATRSSIVSAERQQSLRERAESMRGGISALEEALLDENIPEEKRRAAQAELQQLRSMVAMLSWMEQSDWAKGLVDEPPPAYNALIGR